MSTSTTLITFILRAPVGTFAVELLGSWDNFSKPYKLSRDRRTGDNNWRGCHLFEGITCDGDTSDLSAMRNGGLMMGGTYWYYYRLNSEAEYHDPAEPYTSSCPLLPGQPVNVLDVPMQPPKTYSGNDSTDSLDSLVFTLDPRDKYLPPGVRRARTTSAIQRRKAGLRMTPNIPLTTSDDEPQESETRPPTATSTREGPTLKPQRSLVSIFEKLRRTKSAGSSATRATTSWHRKVFSRAGSRSGMRPGSSKKPSPLEDTDIPAVPQVPVHILAAPKSNNATTRPPSHKISAACIKTDPLVSLTAATASLSLASELGNRSSDDGPEYLLSPETVIVADVVDTSLGGRFGAPSKARIALPHAPELDLRKEQYTKPDEHSPPIPEIDPSIETPAASSVFHRAAAALRRSPSHSETRGDDASPRAFDGDLESTKHADTVFQSGYADSSYATDEDISPHLVSNSAQFGPMSPMQLSQPDTPAMSDFEDDAASWTRGSDSLDLNTANIPPPSRAPPPPPPTSQHLAFPNPFRIQTPLSGFQGYSLPLDQSGSTHTIRKRSSMTFGHPELPLHHQTSSKDLVDSWNDGSEHRITALEELVDDLGYLGAFIV